MARFTDLLNNPLPSKTGYAMEGFDNDDDVTPVDAGEDVSDIELGENDGSIATDDLDDVELSDLDRELTNGDDEEEITLTPDEEIQADDMMSVAATSMLVNDELSSDEKKEFSESADEVKTAIAEGFMTEADADLLAVNCGLMAVQEGKYSKPMLIRLDAESKKKQLYAIAINVSAAAHNDPDYIKLRKVMKMRKVLRAKLEKKYHAEAMKRMKVYYKRLNNSKSQTLRTVAQRSEGK